MTFTDEHGRVEPPLTGNERETLLGFLDYQRATFAWKIAGLDAAGLSFRFESSAMTLGGMAQHLALVEDSWFSRLQGRELGSPWDAVDWDEDPDWEWHAAANEPPESLRALWQAAVERSRTAVADALAEEGLDQLARWSFRDGRSPSLRWIICHMIEEYARHNGHADLLREAVDGETGE